MFHFKLSFCRPQVNSCCTCEELKVKLHSSNLCDSAKLCAEAELCSHKRNSQNLCALVMFDSTDWKNDDITLFTAFDFMQNTNLSQISVQNIFYLCQMTISIFSIHNLKDNTVMFYIYHEGMACKELNKVCSFLHNYLMQVPPIIKNIHLYSENCGGQNKNHSLCRMLLALTDT